MKLKYAFLLVIPLFICGINRSLAAVPEIEINNAAWTRHELNTANTAKDVDYLSNEEKAIILYLNLVRMDAEKFFNTFFQDFVKSNNKRMQQYKNYKDLRVDTYDRYYRGLAKDVKGLKNLSLLYPDETLTYVALQHGKDMNRKNIARHKSSDGRSPQDRMAEYFKGRAMSENLAFGFPAGLDVVCMLLLDKGVPDLGHRKSILNSTYGFNLVGVSIQKHPSYKYSATIDFVAIPEVKN